VNCLVLPPLSINEYIYIYIYIYINKWNHQLQAYSTTPPVWSRQDQQEIRLQHRRAVSFHLDSLATSITDYSSSYSTVKRKRRITFQMQRVFIPTG
jgi:hypothetical protein